MKIIDNKKFYDDSIKEYGVSAKGVHWNSKYTQYKRFEVLTNLIKKDIATSTIVDAGCGFSHYYNYLNNNNKLPLHYTGIDCENSMIAISKKRFSNIDFYVKNILDDELIYADYYVCSGAMNILEDKDVFIFIESCFKYSNKGFVFNFLKDITFNNVSYYEIIYFVQSLSSNIKVKDDYLNNDFTILMLK